MIKNNQIPKQKPLIVSGCSGVGKGALITTLIQQFPEVFKLSVSYTTRKPRESEQDGREYYFVDRQHILQEIKKETLLEHCQVHGNMYGTHEQKVQEIIDKGKVFFVVSEVCILDVDIQGAEKIYKKHPGWNYIFVKPPSIEALEQRLINRKSQTADSIKLRVGNAKKQLDRVQKLSFYHHLVNDNIDDCYFEFIKFINNTYQLLIEVQKPN